MGGGLKNAGVMTVVNCIIKGNQATLVVVFILPVPKMGVMPIPLLKIQTLREIRFLIMGKRIVPVVVVLP